MPGPITPLPTPPSTDDPSNFETRGDAFLGALPGLADEINELAASLNSLSTTTASVTSISIGTGTKNFTVETGKSLFVGMSYRIAYDANNWMNGEIISYDSGTGALSLDVDNVQGAGMYAAWVGTLSFSGTLPNDAVIARTLADSAIANTPILNGYIEWTISGNALTAAVKTLAGSDPSTTDPVYAVFRNPTLGTAGYFVRAITAALSITCPDTGTLGTVSALASRIRAAFIDNGGTVDIGLYNTWENTNRALLPLDESGVYTTVAIGTGSDSAHVLYANSVLASKAIREVGYVESVQTTAGTWAQALSKKVTAGAGYRRSGERVQERYLLKTDTYSNTTSPANVTGLELAITPRSAANKMLVTATLNVGASSTQAVFLRMVRDGVSIFDGDAAGSRRSVTQSVFPSQGSVAQSASMMALDSPNSASEVIYAPQIWGSVGTQYINRSGTDTNSADFTRAVSNIRAEEIFA